MNARQHPDLADFIAAGELDDNAPGESAGLAAAMDPAPAAVAARATREGARARLTAVRPRPARKRRAAQPAGQALNALEQVMASRDTAVATPGEMTDFGIRLPPDLKHQADVWVVSERARTGDRRLHLTHVVDAAVARLPDNASQAAQIGISWRQARAITEMVATGSGRRLRKQNALKLASLSDRLRLLNVRVPVWQVVAGEVTALLAELSQAETPENSRGERGDRQR